MPVLVLEGPDGLGKSALAQLIKNQAMKLANKAVDVRTPEPSRHFGKFPNALEYAANLLEETPTELHDPPGFVLYDRFPIPSEFVYNPTYGLVPNDPEYRQYLELMSHHPDWKFVLIMPEEQAIVNNKVRERIGHILDTDPMYTRVPAQSRYQRWVRYYYRYGVWRCHNRNLIMELTWTPTTWWDEKTAYEVLKWSLARRDWK